MLHCSWQSCPTLASPALCLGACVRGTWHVVVRWWCVEHAGCSAAVTAVKRSPRARMPAPSQRRLSGVRAARQRLGNAQAASLMRDLQVGLVCSASCCTPSSSMPMLAPLLCCAVGCSGVWRCCHAVLHRCSTWCPAAAAAPRIAVPMPQLVRGAAVVQCCAVLTPQLVRGAAAAPCCAVLRRRRSGCVALLLHRAGAVLCLCCARAVLVVAIPGCTAHDASPGIYFFPREQMSMPSSFKLARGRRCAS
jgi:hypothetical protein